MQPVSSDRLIAAADASLAMCEPYWARGEVAEMPFLRRGDADCPDVIKDFTVEELEAAAMFLVRCGYFMRETHGDEDST